jgi:hypothetical protein
MTEYLSNWNVVLDSEQAEILPDGTLSQEITLLLTGEPCGSGTRRPVAVTLSPGRARMLAAVLLARAEQAEPTVGL